MIECKVCGDFFDDEEAYIEHLRVMLSESVSRIAMDKMRPSVYDDDFFSSVYNEELDV